MVISTTPSWSEGLFVTEGIGVRLVAAGPRWRTLSREENGYAGSAADRGHLSLGRPIRIQRDDRRAGQQCPDCDSQLKGCQ
jgi:hypothetical protein